MSRSDRDQKGGHPVRHPRLLDCLCCEDRSNEHRLVPRAITRTAAIEEQLEGQTESTDGCVDEHVYLTGRCLRCNTRELDATIYPGLELCPDRAADAPVRFTTTTGEPQHSSHELPTYFDLPLDQSPVIDLI